MSYSLASNAPPSRIIYMNSEDVATGGNFLEFRNGRPLTTDFEYTFETAIMIPENIDTLVSLSSASVPYSFYNIRFGVNDTIDFNLRRYKTNAGVIIPPPIDLTTPSATQLVSTITIPAGNYTINSLYTTIIYYLKIAISSYDPNSPFTAGVLSNIDFRFYYDRIKQKSILSFLPSWDAGTSAEGVGAIFTFLSNIGTNFTRRLTKEIGLIENDIQNFYISNVARPTFSDTYEVGTINLGEDYQSNIPNTLLNPQLEFMFLSPSCVDVSGVKGVYVRTNLTSIGTLDTQSGNYSSILSRIPINVNAGDVIYLDSSNSKHKTIVSLPFIKTIRIKLTDERNRILDLNGLDFQVAIQFDFVYNKPHITPLDSEGRRLYSHYLDRERDIEHKRTMRTADRYKKTKIDKQVVK